MLTKMTTAAAVCDTTDDAKALRCCQTPTMIAADNENVVAISFIFCHY